MKSTYLKILSFAGGSVGRSLAAAFPGRYFALPLLTLRFTVGVVGVETRFAEVRY